MSKSLFTIKALRLETAVSEHLRDLGVLWVCNDKRQSSRREFGPAQYTLLGGEA